MRRSASVSVVVIVATVLIGSGVPSDAGLATTGVGAGPMLAGGVLVSSSLFAWSEVNTWLTRQDSLSQSVSSGARSSMSGS